MGLLLLGGGPHSFSPGVCLCLASVLTEQTSSVCSLTCAESLIIYCVPIFDLKQFFSSFRNVFFNGGKSRENLVSSLWPLEDEQLGVLVFPQATGLNTCTQS